MPDDDRTPPSLRVIAVGSSAGGLDALTKLLGAVDAGLGWCFVLAQHLSPTDQSALVSLLGRITALRVVEATDGAELESDVVFVAPPGVDIVVSGTTLGLVEPDDGHRPWPSIDRLLTSAADALGGDCVGVVLSGTGEDGAAGVEAIKGAGGVVIVQDQTTAAFGAMPGAAYATGSVDLQLAPQDIPAALERILAADAGDRAVADHARSATPGGAQGLDDAAIEDVIAALRSATGVDYSGYKRSTMRRQVERRLRIVNRTPADYVGVLARDAAEAEALSRGVLVGVTAFFRDRPVWDALADQLRVLVDNLEPVTQLRIWVPGCASGEEAYTVAMLAAEALGSTYGDLSGRMKIFATDLDERALAVARRARYSEAAVAAVPEELRERWMRQIEQDWEVIPTLRECVVIARHNVAFDPPFPRIHLISLRNTLIYFQPHLQDRVLQLCRFALRPDGLLVLGKSERVPRADALFSVAEQGHRIYRRRYSTEVVALPSGRYAPTLRVAAAPLEVAAEHDHGIAHYRRLLQVLAAPALVLDDQDTLIEVIGDVSTWCAVAEGRHTGHVADLLRKPYRLLVRTMLSQLRHSAPDVVIREVSGPDGPVEVTVTRLSSGGVGAAVSFRVLQARPGASDPNIPMDATASQVNAALESAQDALQATVEDLGSSNEELQALNEELQASTEELQATSEEAQASNEELEAANEELTTLNQELQARGAELMNANTDLENIQASLTSGLVMVDRDLRVTRYSPLAVRVFSLIREDIGRPLPAVPTTIAIPTLTADLLDTMASRATRLIELSHGDRDFLLQIQPYTGSSGEVLGALVVVIDVSDVAEARRDRERALTNLQTVAESVRELVWQRDGSAALTFLTSRVEDIYGLDRDRVLADPALLVGAVYPADRERVAAATASADRRWQVEYRIVRPDGTIRWIDESAAQNGSGADRTVTGSALDVTDRHQLQRAATQRGAVLDALLSTRTVGVLVLDANDRILQISDSVAAIIGYPPETLVGTPLNVLLEPDPVAALLPGSTVREELAAGRMLAADGTYRAVTMELLLIAPVDDADPDEVPGRVVVVHDVSRLREISADLADREQFDQQTGLLTRTYFRSRTDELVTAGIEGLAVLLIDLDGFKEVNDRLGHRAGDVVLAAVASRLQRTARRHDIIGRLGGDEFAVLITRVEDLDGIETLVHRLLSAVREPIDVDGTRAYVSASVGIAMQPQDGRTADELLHNADTAMYVAKQRGRDRHAYFTNEMNDRADERSALRHALADAVRHRNFELHYQPVLEVTTRRVVYVEALLRWRRGDELVAAESFITHAADTGQLRAIGRIVLGLLDADITTMHGRLGDCQPRVAVNLSAPELEERTTTDWLLAWNPAGGFDRVIAEVTESTLLVPGGRAMDTLAVLRRLGVTIGIDDFGTGYSNLELLGRLAPEIIKIDRSLLDRACEPDQRGSKILQAAIQLAHAVDAQVVVEGVADQLMWEHVVGVGAELAQGYFLAPPMSLPMLIDWITVPANVRPQ
ncbi:MAG: EAL domain-containing protein [Mycobacterium sp.]